MNTTMTTKETIQKGDEELREDCKNVYALIQKGVLNEYHLFLFFKGHTSLRNKAILEVYKEELREKILSQRPKTDDGMVSTIYATGWADREDEIFALINKETE